MLLATVAESALRFCRLRPLETLMTHPLLPFISTSNMGLTLESVSERISTEFLLLEDWKFIFASILTFSPG